MTYYTSKKNSIGRTLHDVLHEELLRRTAHFYTLLCCSKFAHSCRVSERWEGKRERQVMLLLVLLIKSGLLMEQCHGWACVLWTSLWIEIFCLSAILNFARALVHQRILTKARWNSRDVLIFSLNIVYSWTYLTVVVCISMLWPVKSEEILLW